MKNSRFKTVYLLLLLFFSFGWMIDNSKGQNNNPFLSLTEEQLLSLPGKSIHDSLVQALLNCKDCKWEISKSDTTHYYTDIHKIRNQAFTYNSYNFGIAIIYIKDTISIVELASDYKDNSDRMWKHYKGTLPYGLNFSMNIETAKETLSKYSCYSYGRWTLCLSGSLSIDYNGEDVYKSKIETIQLLKKYH